MHDAHCGEGNIVTRISRYRWVICGLLFFATTINLHRPASHRHLESTLAKESAGPRATLPGSSILLRRHTLLVMSLAAG